MKDIFFRIRQVSWTEWDFDHGVEWHVRFVIPRVLRFRGILEVGAGTGLKGILRRRKEEHLHDGPF